MKEPKKSFNLHEKEKQETKKKCKCRIRNFHKKKSLETIDFKKNLKKYCKTTLLKQYNKADCKNGEKHKIWKDIC